MDIHAFWQDVITKNRDALPSYFHSDAVIRWHCTNEQFTVAEYIRANCDYPGNWSGIIERIEQLGPITVMAGRVFPSDQSLSFHVVSFIRTEKGKISEMDEYWSDDEEAPAWRRQMGIGKKLR